MERVVPNGYMRLASVLCLCTNGLVTGTILDPVRFRNVDVKGTRSRLLMFHLERVRSGEDLQSGPRPVATR